MRKEKYHQLLQLFLLLPWSQNRLSALWPHPVPSQGTGSSAASTGTYSFWAAGSHRDQLALLICSCLISVNWVFSVPYPASQGCHWVAALSTMPCLLWDLTCRKGGSSGAEDREEPAEQRTEFNAQKCICPTLPLLLHPKSVLACVTQAQLSDAVGQEQAAGHLRCEEADNIALWCS